MIQILVRAYRHLAITQLGIAVVAFASCATVIYALNWKKPNSMGVPWTMFAFAGPVPESWVREIGEMRPVNSLILSGSAYREESQRVNFREASLSLITTVIVRMQLPILYSFFSLQAQYSVPFTLAQGSSPSRRQRRGPSGSYQVSYVRRQDGLLFLPV